MKFTPYSKAPLPFQGQKRNFQTAFQKLLQKMYTEKYIFVDLFGGSGLLSHYVKQVFPNAIVIYNDYDNYSKRLRAIPKTNKILAEIRDVLKNYPDGKKIDEPYRSKIINIISKYNKKGFVDYITVGSSILFSMKYVLNLEQLKNETLYNNIVQKDYNADGYLHGISVTRADYKKLFNKYKNRRNVVFLIDPPYLSTDNKTYLSENYWTLNDYLDILLLLLENTNFFYFTSEKSDIVELLKWLGTNVNKTNYLRDVKTVKIQSNLNYNSVSKEIMLFRKK